MGTYYYALVESRNSSSDTWSFEAAFWIPKAYFLATGTEFEEIQPFSKELRARPHRELGDDHTASRETKSFAGLGSMPLAYYDRCYGALSLLEAHTILSSKDEEGIQRTQGEKFLCGWLAEAIDSLQEQAATTDLWRLLLLADQ